MLPCCYCAALRVTRALLLLPFHIAIAAATLYFRCARLLMLLICGAYDAAMPCHYMPYAIITPCRSRYFSLRAIMLITPDATLFSRYFTLPPPARYFAPLAREMIETSSYHRETFVDEHAGRHRARDAAIFFLLRYAAPCFTARYSQDADSAAAPRCHALCCLRHYVDCCHAIDITMLLICYSMPLPP